jgi:hypothetical protein
MLVSYYRDENTTINAQYQIDTDRNNGLDFQYDAVVRDRQERKHLNAGDCECCRGVRVSSARTFMVSAANSICIVL